MNLFSSLTAIFIIFAIFKVSFGAEIINAEEYSNDEGIVSTLGDIFRQWGTINSNSIRMGRPQTVVQNVSMGEIAATNFTYIAPRTIDGIRLRSLQNTGAFADIISGGVGSRFAIFHLIGHSNFIHFTIEFFENFSSTPTPPIIFQEWGTVNEVSQILFPRSNFVGIANIGVIFRQVLRENYTDIIDGVRLLNEDNSIASAEIVDGGVGFNFVAINVTAVAHFLSCSIHSFRNGTLITTTPPPDFYVQHWGTVHGGSVLLSNNRHSYYPLPMQPADRRITENTDRPIHAMRLYALNGTRGAYALIEGGLGYNFVTFRFVGESLGRGFDFRLELYNSATSKSLSVALVLFMCLMHNIMK